MKIDDYPPQEPLNENGFGYKTECLRLSAGIDGIEAAYGLDDPTQGVLVFPSKSPDGTVLGWMHGGGWTNGYKEMMAFMAPPLNAAGITFISFSYRMAPTNVFPTGLHDAADAVAWIYRHVAQHGGRPDRIFIGGHSAGAHYASLLAVTTDWTAPRGLPADVIKGCLPISGIYDFTPGSGLSMRPRFLGPEENRGDVKASPLFQLHRRVPMLLAHGSDDFPHLSVQAKKMEAVLREKAFDIERLEFPGRTHFTACYAAGEPDGPWARRAIDWMHTH